jgi:hypothetical protein
MRRLQLQDLDKRHPGLTPAMAEVFFEAASVCFSRHHSRPSDIRIELASHGASAELDWLPPTPRVQAAYANTIDTTEAGAYGVSLAAVELEAGLVAIQRAETMSGADYYVAPIGGPEDLEEALRLEVSGSDLGGRSVCRSRLSQKIEQTRKANHANPALASVVGFSERLILVSELIDP